MKGAARAALNVSNLSKIIRSEKCEPKLSHNEIIKKIYILAAKQPNVLNDNNLE